MENLGEIIDEGGYGYIYNMLNDDKIVAKISKKAEDFDIDIENRCISGKGCNDEIILEGLIMEKLSSLKSKHFVHFKGLYNCDNKYILLMEKLNGISYQSLLKQNINDNIKLQILFQITYALYIANTKLNFVHGDLISKNIMIENVEEEDYEYIIDNKKIYVPNMGVRAIIFDFGFSRLNYKGWKFYQYSQKHYKNDDELFDGTADVCKIYNNPTMALPKLFSNIIVNGLPLNKILKTCKTVGWSYIPVPPFPKLQAIDILRTNLFDELYKNITPVSKNCPTTIVKKCPKGCIKNKKTKLCESKHKSPIKKSSSKKSSPKKSSPKKSLPKTCKFKNKNVDLSKEIKKCPNGCVKNKKTKLCEPK